MKKELAFVCAFIFCIFFINLANAAPTISFNKEIYQPGETLIGNITGDFAKTISLDQIKFFDNRGKQVSLEYGLISYNKIYYFYVYLTNPGNFTMRVNDVMYKETILKTISLNKIIEVRYNLNDTKIISIKPGFIFTSEKQSELTLINKGNSSLNLSYGSESIQLMPGDTKKIKIFSDKPFSFFNLLLEDYESFSIPLIYAPLGPAGPADQNNTGVGSFEQKLKANPSYLQFKIIAENKSEEVIQLSNFAENNLSGFSFSTDIPVMTIKEIDFIPQKSVSNLSLEFFSDKPGFYKGSISINFSEENSSAINTLLIPMEVYAFPKDTKNESMEIEKNACTDLNGKFCSLNETCNGELNFTYDGYCCLGTCESIAPKEDSTYKWIIGVAILILLGFFGFLVYRKVKKTKPSTPEERFKEASKSYEKRVSGDLSRV